MSKIYFLADTHLGVKSDNPIILHDWIDYYNKVFIPYCKEHVQPDDILVHLGDVFDNRNNINLETINFTIRLFEDLSEIFNDIRITIGNHDIFQKHSNEITSVNVLKHIPHVKLYYTPQVEVIDDKSVLFVPWIEDVNKQKELLKSHDVNYIFGHLEINGAVTSSKGTKLHSDNSIQSIDFKKSQVYAGHIHIRQNIGKYIHYVGTPYMVNRGDIGNKKGFTILDMKTGSTEFIENTFSPQYKRYSIYDILDKTVEELKSEWRNNYIDLCINSNHITYCTFDLMRNIFDGVYKEFNTVTNKIEDVVENKDIKLSENKSVTEVIKEYMNFNDIDLDMQEKIKSRIEAYKERI